MKMLLVIGLLAFIALVVALAVRRGPGGYRRRFAPLPPGRKRPDSSSDASAVWAPAVFGAGSPADHGGHGADCGSGAHSGGDCGASAGGDGGGGS